MSNRPDHPETGQQEAVSIGSRKTVTNFLIVLGTAVALLLIIRFLIL